MAIPKKKSVKKNKKNDGETAEQRIVIQPLERTLITVKVRSTTSLIMNNVTQAAIDLEKMYNLKVPKGDPGYLENLASIDKLKILTKNPTRQFENSIWNIPGTKNKYGIPAVAFKKGMVRAGKLCGYDMTDTMCAFFVCTEVGRYIPIKGSKPILHEDIVRQQGGQKMPTPRYRAEMLEWSATLRIEYDAGLISAESVVELLNHAGFRVGAGDKRKEKGFEHGGYEVVVGKPGKKTKKA